MTWQKLAGHDRIALEFARGLARGRLTGSFLFVGDNGIGKRSFALALAKTLLCKNVHLADESNETALLDSFVPCDHCDSCRMFNMPAETVLGTDKDSWTMTLPGHPDLLYVCKSPNKTELALDILIGEKGKRNSSGLCYEIFKRPFLGKRKIAIIDDADFMNDEGANAILKTLEEPPDNAIIILIGTNASRQLPTIRSRCRIFRFYPLNAREMAEQLLQRQEVSNMEQALLIANESNGSFAQIESWNDSELAEFRDRLYRELAQGRIDPIAITKLLTDYGITGADTPASRRKRLKSAFLLIAQFFRYWLIVLATNSTNELPLSVRSCFHAIPSGQKYSREMAIQYVQSALEATIRLDANANQNYVIDSWLPPLF